MGDLINEKRLAARERDNGVVAPRLLPIAAGAKRVDHVTDEKEGVAGERRASGSVPRRADGDGGSGGGGGGSNFVDPATVMNATPDSLGQQFGNGLVVVTFNTPTVVTVAPVVVAPRFTG